MSRFPETVEQEIVTRYLAGESTVVLAKAYGMTRGGIRAILTRHQIERRKVGERPPRSDAILYQLDTEMLVDMVRQGMSTREIARAFNVSATVIHATCVSLHIPLGDRLEQSLTKRCRQIPDTLFALPLPPTESWLLGLLMTDGNVSTQGRVRLTISDEDGVRLASQFIGFGSIRIAPPNPRTTAIMWSFQTHSRRLAQRLETLGVTPRKTRTLAFPNPSDLSLPDFIRGLWDGDGSWYLDRRDNSLSAHFGCASEPFIQALRSITADVTGSIATIRKHAQKEFWQLSYQGRSAVTLAHWLYYDTTIACLKRKQAVVTPFL